MYTGNLIGPANTFSAAVGGGTSDARLQGTITTLAALLAVENEQSVQRAVLYAALSAQPPVLTPEDLTSLQQAEQSSGRPGRLHGFRGHHRAAALREHRVRRGSGSRGRGGNARRGGPVGTADGRNTGLDAATWYGDMSTTIGDTRKVTGQLAGQITVRADTLKSNATRSLLLTSIVTLLLLVLLISAAAGRSLTRPPRH